MIEMYLAGVSTRRIEDASEILWGSKVSAATVSNLNEKAFESVERWHVRPLKGNTPTSTSMASTSSAAGADRTRTSR
jgi:putative transposase